MQGTVKKWFNGRKYGFIAADDGNEYFVHIRSVRSLAAGVRVDFEAAETDRGLVAENVAVTGE